MARLPGLVFYGTTGKFTWRMLATVLAGQSIVIFFGALVARAVAATGPDVERSGTYLAIGTALAVLCLVAAGSLRRPWGVTLGWLVQAGTLLAALVVPLMLVVGLVFLALWVVSLVQGGRVDAGQAARAPGTKSDPAEPATEPGPGPAPASDPGPGTGAGPGTGPAAGSQRPDRVDE